MTITRRKFLGTLVAASVIASETSQTLAARLANHGDCDSVSSRITLLRSGSINAQFEAGVRSSIHPLVLELNFSDFVDTKSRLADAGRGMLVGWVQPSEFVLLNESLRDLGGSIWLQGSHFEAEGCSRHHFVTSKRSAGMGAEFARSFDHPHAMGLVYESDRFSGRAGRQSRIDDYRAISVDSAVQRTFWPQRLGAQMALIASDQWQPLTIERNMSNSNIQKSSWTATGISFIASI